MPVYVQNKNGQPLMPTERYGKVRRMLKSGQAEVIRRCPFTIRLLYDTGDQLQPISLGIDAGSKVIGTSACTEAEELYASEVHLRTDITKNLSSRREFRRSRRNRKTRYRKPRFNNRVKSKHKDWLAPSVEAKISAHIKTVEEIIKLLPVSKITVEVASFDTQLLKAMENGNPLPEGTDYQQGEQLGFWNVREYVLCRDGHVCQCCNGKYKDKILNVHHIESRQTGGDAPDNLVTLCETCHSKYHQGKIKLPEMIQRDKSLRDAAFMGIMRWTFYNRLKEMYPGMVFLTYGYITKDTRIKHKLGKSHIVDARCIAGCPDAKPLEHPYLQKKVRCHNRQLHKATTIKGGIRKRNQAAYEVMGFRIFDRIRYKRLDCFVFGRRTSGSFDIRTLDGTVISRGAGYRHLKLLERSKHTLTERMAFPPTTEVVGFHA